MSLVGNYSHLQKTPGRWLGGQEAQYRANWNQANSARNFGLQPNNVALRSVAVPPGTSPPYSYVLPYSGGAMASHNAAVGAAALVASGLIGRALAGAVGGVGAVVSSGQLVVPAFGGSSGGAAALALALGLWPAAGTLPGSGNAVGTISARGAAVAVASAASAVSADLEGTGALAGTALVGIAAVLTAPGIAAEILDQQLVETGLSVRETLRLCAAALAGKIAGAAGPVVTIRNAVADDVIRITATVDESGNRTAIDYELD